MSAVADGVPDSVSRACGGGKEAMRRSGLLPVIGVPMIGLLFGAAALAFSSPGDSPPPPEGSRPDADGSWIQVLRSCPLGVVRWRVGENGLLRSTDARRECPLPRGAWGSGVSTAFARSRICAGPRCSGRGPRFRSNMCCPPALCSDRVAHGHRLGELIHRGIRLRRQLRQRVRMERLTVMNRAGTESSSATAAILFICGLMLDGRSLCRG
jgi:hypothetical protein